MPFTRYGRPGLLGTIPRTAVIAGIASVTANVISREAAEETHAALRSAEADAAAAGREAERYAHVAPSPIGGGMVSQLRELARLRDSGALSQEEYPSAKYRLLGN